MAGVSKHLGDSEDFWSYSSTRFDSSIVCEKQWVERWMNFQKQECHTNFNSNFPFIGVKIVVTTQNRIQSRIGLISTFTSVLQR